MRIRVLDDAWDAVVNAAARQKDQLSGVVHNVRSHIDDLRAGFRSVDTFDASTSHTPNVPNTRRTGFNHDGSVNPDDFSTPTDGAYYWSGMYPRNGQEIAGRIAADNDATTLEMLIDERGIDMPEWDAENPTSVDTWTQVSEAYANGANGTVRAVLGENLRPDAVWWKELERLKNNPNITQIIRIDPDTLVETVIWPV